MPSHERTSVLVEILLQLSYGFLFSTPIALGSGSVSSNTVSLTAPLSTPFGEHRLALYTADGTLIGWDAVTVLDPSAISGGGSGAGSGAGSDAGSDAAADPLATTGLDAQWLLLWVALGAGIAALGVTLVLRRRKA